MTPRRVLVVAPPAIARAIVSHLEMNGASVDTSAGVPANAVVFAPADAARRPDQDTMARAVADCGAAARSGARHVVLISSAAVYGASPYTPGFVDETWVAPPTHPNRVAAWWTAFEREAARVCPGAAITILRPAPLLDGESYVSQLFTAPVAFTVAGHDPPIQLLSLDDLAA